MPDEQTPEEVLRERAARRVEAEQLRTKIRAAKNKEQRVQRILELPNAILLLRQAISDTVDALKLSDWPGGELKMVLHHYEEHKSFFGKHHYVRYVHERALWALRGRYSKYYIGSDKELYVSLSSREHPDKYGNPLSGLSPATDADLINLFGEFYVSYEGIAGEVKAIRLGL